MENNQFGVVPKNSYKISKNKSIKRAKTIQDMKKEFQMSEQDIKTLKESFEKMNDKSTYLTRQQFRNSLGILSIESANFLSDTMFDQMNKDNDGMVTLYDFVEYMNIVIKGDEYQKAKQSFRFIDNQNNGVIKYENIERIVKGVQKLWNFLTGSKVQASKKYIRQLYHMFDKNNQGYVTFEDYNEIYSMDRKIFGWFEFLNDEQQQDEQEIDEQNQNDEQDVTVRQRLSLMEKEVQLCLKIIQQQSQKDSNFNLKESRCIVSENISEEPLYMILKDQIINDPTLVIQQQTPLESIQSSDDIQEKEILNKLQQKLIRLKSQIINVKNDPNNLEDKIQPINIMNVQNIFSKYRQNDNASKNNIGVSIGRLSKKRQTIIGNIGANTSLKKNLSVFFGHDNWNLVLNMMIGIRTSLKGLFPQQSYDVSDEDFHIKCNYELMQKRTQGFDYRKAYKFYDYAPRVFECIRRQIGITNDDYLKSIGPEQFLSNVVFGDLQTLTELSSSGKSGSFFYYTQDSKYMLKTISKGESKLLRKMLKNYFHHLTTNKTIISKQYLLDISYNYILSLFFNRIFGLHKMKIQKNKTNSSKIYFIIMENLFSSDIDIDVRYDLKGSTQGRTSLNQDWNKGIALKDLDFLNDNIQLHLTQDDKAHLYQSIQKDSQFFADNQVIDYSLLIGIHTTTQSNFIVNHSAEISKIKKEIQNYKLQGTKMPPYYMGGIISSNLSQIYFIGIIDILTEYGTKKKLEYGFKKTIYGSGVSCVPPKEYANRFKEFFNKTIFQ